MEEIHWSIESQNSYSSESHSTNLDILPASHSTEEGEEEEESIIEYGQVQAQKLVVLLKVFQL